MSTVDSYVRARIDTDTKQRATEALDAMGISVSDAIRLLMIRVADERRLPFEIKAPNKDTQKAMNSLIIKKPFHLIALMLLWKTSMRSIKRLTLQLVTDARSR